MQTYWEIEEGCNCDFAFVEIKGPSDASFVSLNDTGNHFTQIVAGYWGLHNWATAPMVMSFDLTPWAGQAVTLRLRYYTDPGYTDIGWWVDDLALNEVVFEDFETATAPSTFPAGWTASPSDGWKVTPYSLTNPKFYLVEWRADSKYDEMLKTAYVTTYSDDDEWQVERVPYNIPAALVYFRDTAYPEGYSQRQYYGNAPSFGPKNKLLLVDVNEEGMRLFDDDNGAYLGYLNNRSAAYDAGLTLQRTEEFSLSSVLGLVGGPFTFVSKPAVTNFNDANGYYPGFYFGPPCAAGSICYTARDGSVVIPAEGNYSTRITDFAGNPFYDLYGAPFGGPAPLGSGNPGDEMVQLGVNVNLLSKSADNKTGVVKVYNYSVDTFTSTTVKWVGVNTYDVTYETVVTNVGTDTAKDIRLTYLLDSRLTYISSSIAPVVTPNAPQGMAKVFNIPSLPAGDSVLVQMVTRFVESGKMPTDVVTRWEMHDGQVERGPWWDYTTLVHLNPTFFPLLFK